MLGKGLESLIPQRPQKNGDGTQPPTGVSSSSQPAQQPREEQKKLPENPGMEPERELPAKPEQKDFPITQSQPAKPQQTPTQNPFFAKDKATPKKQSEGEAVFQIEVDKIHPNPQQPRRNFDEEALKDLAHSIREHGILQPIVVTRVYKEVPTGTEIEYQLIAGERRLMASKLLGMERIPAIIRNVELEKERLELAIIENLQRENLSPIEMARAFSKLQDEFRLTQREIGARLGKSREVVANTVRLLDLPADIQKAIEENKITESHGRLLLGVQDNPPLQKKLFDDLLGKKITTRELKERVRVGKPRQASVVGEQLTPEFQMIQERLSSELGTPVKISHTEAGGKITISFYSKEELDQILHKFGTDEVEL